MSIPPVQSVAQTFVPQTNDLVRVLNSRIDEMFASPALGENNTGDISERMEPLFVSMRDLLEKNIVDWQGPVYDSVLRHFLESTFKMIPEKVPQGIIQRIMYTLPPSRLLREEFPMLDLDKGWGEFQTFLKPKFEWVKRSFWDKVQIVALTILTFGHWKNWKNEEYFRALDIDNPDFKAAEKAIKSGADRLHPMTYIRNFAPLHKNSSKSFGKLSFLFAQMKSNSHKKDPINKSEYRYDLKALKGILCQRNSRTDRALFDLIDRTLCSFHEEGDVFCEQILDCLKDYKIADPNELYRLYTGWYQCSYNGVDTGKCTTKIAESMKDSFPRLVQGTVATQA